MFGLDVFLPLLGAVVMLLRGGSPAAGPAPAPLAPRPLPPAPMADPAAALSALAREWTQSSADGGSAYGNGGESFDSLLSPAPAPVAPVSEPLPPPVSVALPPPAPELARAPLVAPYVPTIETPGTTGLLPPAPAPAPEFAPAPAPAWDRTQTYEYEPSRDTLISQARTLYQYLIGHSGAARDRQYVAALQTRLGLVGDGLVGRQTASRIRELTGLTLPGF